MTLDNHISELAAGLTSGARRACLAMTCEWAFCGKQTFDANGAHNLFWKCGGVGPKNQFVERKAMKDGKWSRTAYRLTKDGLRLRSHVRALAKESRHD